MNDSGGAELAALQNRMSSQAEHRHSISPNSYRSRAPFLNSGHGHFSHSDYA